MGTSYSITVEAGAQPVPEDLAEQVKAVLDRVDALMSTYKPQSQLNQLNALAAGETMQVAPELAAVLALSATVYQLTDGAFDPTVGPLVDLWGFGPQNTGDQLPSKGEIDLALAQLGFDQLTLTGLSVQKQKAVSLDLSAVAKGYAADLVSDLLKEQGLTNHLVEVGGELRLSGLKSNGDAWVIGVEKPALVRGEAQVAIAVTGVGVATSGDYRNYFERDGVRYSHTLDPRTGYPVTHKLASVTVFADNAGLADALATGFMVLGDQQTLEIAERQDIPVYLLVKEGDTFVAHYSSAFETYLP